MIVQTQMKTLGNISLFICLNKQATKHTTATFLIASRPQMYANLYLEHSAFPHWMCFYLWLWHYSIAYSQSHEGEISQLKAILYS